jgi:hypothetical protein
VIIRSVVLSLLATVCVSCRAPDPSPEHSAAIPSLRLADAPRTSIGGLDDRAGYAIGSLAAAVLIRDRIVIADGSASEVRFYDREGELVHRSGRNGSGPGEYRALRYLAPAGDTAVAAWDPQLQRATFVGERSVFTVTPQLSDAQSMLPRFVGVMPSSEIVFRDEKSVMGMGAEPSGPRRDTVTYHFVGYEGETVGKLRVPGDESWFVNEGNRWTREPIILGKRVVEAITPGGLLLGETDGLRFTRSNGRGAAQPLYSLPYHSEPATSFIIDEEREIRIREARRSAEGLAKLRMVADGKPVDFSEFTGSVIGRLPAASTIPAYSTLYGASEGFWYCKAGRAAQTCTLVSDGIVEGSVDIPVKWRVHAFGQQEVLVSQLDELDRVTVLLYPITMQN